ncbi:MAG: hypothetical protein U0984_04535 [Prosthecobacter sp.]|nr:hypothetical protein [Prosthecobacter sp.]
MTKREQRLALGFGVVMIAGGAFVGLTQLKAWKQRVDVRSLALDTRRAEAHELLAEKDSWEQRSAWLQQKQPMYTKRSEADLTVLNLIRDSASSHSVTVQVQPMEPSERPGMTSSSMTVEAKGDLAAVLKWLHGIQEPNTFISIPALSMVPNEEDTSQVIVNMTVQKWFRLPPT